MRIAYVSVASPLSRRSWSGIPWYSLKALQARFDDVHVVETPRLDRSVERLAVAEHFNVPVRRNAIVSQLYKRAIGAALEEIRPDVVVGVAAAHKLALIDPRWPLIYASDALFGSVVHYYEKYKVYTPRTIAHGNKLQKQLHARVDRFLLASDWAAEDAVARYDLPPEKVGVAPMGANIDSVPEFTEAPREGPLRLLFVGYAWERKGGPMVLQIWRELYRLTGGNAQLHIIGANPKEAEGMDDVIVHGLINKTDPEAYKHFVELYQQAHFMVMPSRQEAYGIVYCEAAAFGRPAVAAVTGGVPTIVKDDRTGIILPLDATAHDYAERIFALWSDHPRYDALCRSARQDFEQRLNWTSWSEKVESAIHEVVGTR